MATSASYLVTGGAGFIGSHIVHALVERGDRVRVLDNLSTGRRENLAAVADDVELVEGDLANSDDVARAVEGVDFILHQGALPSVPRSIADPHRTNASNVTGTVNLLWAAKETGVRRVVVASSSSVYGDTEVLPKVETMPTSPLSPYAVSKLATEAYAVAFHRSFGLETVALRYFNVFGPRQDPYSQYAAVVPKFLDIMKRGDTPVIFGDGEQSRDFTYVANVVKANLLAAEASGVVGEVMNFACGTRSTLNDLVAVLNDLLGTDITPEYAEPRLGDVKHSQADISKARRLLGYEPAVSFRQGVAKLVELAEK